MDFGPHTLQISVSLIVVLAVAGVAFVCDLLKGNNEHLRELAIELKVRYQEAERRIRLIQKAGPRIQDRGSIKPNVVDAPVSEMASSPAPAAVPEERLEATSEPVQVPLPPGVSPQVQLTTIAAEAPPERRRQELSRAVAAIRQSAAAMVNNKEQVPELVAAASTSAFPSASTFPSALTFASSPSQAEVSSSSPAGSSGRRKNWDSILKKTARRKGSVIPFESIREATPAGFHEASVLQRSIESGRIISGLVVSIGTNALSAEGASEVAEFLKGQMSGQDFACQSGIGEYILICGREQGAAAQRRLSAIAETLWDFQLRSIGGNGVQFSWGSHEARGERIGEAVAIAIEQMQDTRQSRRGNIARAV